MYCGIGSAATASTEKRSHHAANTFFIEERNQTFADSELGDDALDIHFWVRTKSLSRGAHRLLILRSESAERVLYPVAQLPQDNSRNIQRILRHKIYADA